MRSHEERIAEAKRRIAKIEREKRLRRNTITAASAVAACLALIVGVSFVMPDIAVKIQTGGYAGFETAASIFHGGAALGYIVIGLLAFLLGVCLLSAYINTFLASVCQADALAATAEIAPVVEEMMKLLPLVFYLLVFEPEGDKIKAAAITVALAFATFENVCYLIQNGADRFSFIFFRGFGTGAMHVLCGLIVGGGLAYAWQRTWLKIAGTWGLLGAAITLHAVYNLLIAYGGAAQYVAYALPVLLVAAGRLSTFRLSRMK